MKVIPHADMTLERLHSLFASNQLSAEIVQNSPAVPELGLDRDAYLRVDCSDSRPLTIWLDMVSEGLIRMRFVILNRDQRDAIAKDELRDEVDFLNQQISCFGTLAAGNALGLTLEYALPYREGILEQTILLAVERLAKGASLGRSHLRRIGR